MKLRRSSIAPSLLIGGALAFSACSGNSAGYNPPDAQNASEASATRIDCGGKQDLRASGSTAQQNAIEQFGFAYARACPGRGLVYSANGSAAGVEDFAGNGADLAGSEVVLDAARGQPERVAARCGSPAWHLPTVFNPIAITYNLDGVGALNLDGPTTAKIFNGSITTWDNPAIKALNAGTVLPSAPIRVIFHSDRSSTTASFQRYLDDASDGGWGSATGDTFDGGVGLGAVGNEGTAMLLSETDGAITYSEWSFAVGKRLPMVGIITAAAPDPVTVTADSVGRTIAGSKFAGRDNDLVLDQSSLFRPVVPDAYPIVMATYEIVCSRYSDPATGSAVKAFLRAAIGPGQEGLEQYGSVPLPQSFQAKLLAAVDALS